MFRLTIIRAQCLQFLAFIRITDGKYNVLIDDLIMNHFRYKTYFPNAKI